MLMYGTLLNKTNDDIVITYINNFEKNYQYKWLKDPFNYLQKASTNDFLILEIDEKNNIIKNANIMH